MDETRRTRLEDILRVASENGTAASSLVKNILQLFIELNDNVGSIDFFTPFIVELKTIGTWNGSTISSPQWHNEFRKAFNIPDNVHTSDWFVDNVHELPPIFIKAIGKENGTGYRHYFFEPLSSFGGSPTAMSESLDLNTEHIKIYTLEPYK